MFNRASRNCTTPIECKVHKICITDLRDLWASVRKRHKLYYCSNCDLWNKHKYRYLEIINTRWLVFYLAFIKYIVIEINKWHLMIIYWTLSLFTNMCISLFNYHYRVLNVSRIFQYLIKYVLTKQYVLFLKKYVLSQFTTFTTFKRDTI